MDYTSPKPESISVFAKIFDRMRRPKMRLALLLVLHTGLFALIYVISYTARYDFAPHAEAIALMWSTMAIVVAIKITVFYISAHFHGWWRYVTFADIKSLLRASLLSMCVVAFVDYFLINHIGQIPRAVIIFDTLLTILMVGGLRCVWRFADEHFGTGFQHVQVDPALLVGTNHQAGILASQINSNRGMPFRIRGLVSVEKEKAGRNRVIAGVPVRGSLDQLEAICSKLGVSQVFVPSNTLTGTDIRELIKTCNRTGLAVRVLPRFEDALAGSSQIPLRELNIEDLLKRDPVQLDKERLGSFIKGKRVLVTGAGGSIGSEICRQLMEFQPAKLVLLGRGENRVYAINGELRKIASENGVDLKPAIADITEEGSMRRVFEDHSPELVFHAAAHKHVPLMEQHVREALRNNVLGTKNVVSLADEFECTHCVMVSTDKAVNPTSVMGATKNIAERVVYSRSERSETKFCVVRFGNVLGSAGSVVPLFQRQISEGGPITVTHPDMTRYFMSIPEASQLVLQAGSMANGGEIFVLDMGEPVKILRLAEDLVELSGLAPGSIEIEFSGVREGEKLYEELYFGDEELIATKHEKVRAAYFRPLVGRTSENEVARIEQSLDLPNEALKDLIQEFVPEYRNESGVSEAVG